MCDTNHTHLIAYLQTLAGGQRDGFIELRYRLADGVGMGQAFETPERLDGLATRAVSLGRRTDVYIGCAPRTRRQGGRAAIDHAHVLWVDCDGPAAVEALRRFQPAPAIVIASGTKTNCHAYWPLSEPLRRDDIERANRRLAHALGADPASADAARILRPPGTRSHKRTPPVEIKTLRLDPTRRAASEIVGRLSDPPQPKRVSRPSRCAISRTGDPLLSIAPPVYVERLLGVQVPRHGKVPCPFHGDQLASLHVYDTPDRGWYCYGACRRGGTIYDLAAPLFGYATRGPQFLALKQELLRLFGLSIPADA